MTELLRGALLALVSATTACSSGGGRARPPGGGGSAVPDAGPPVAAAPSERECDDLIAHAIALRTAELARTLPADQLPTEAEQAALRAELRTTFLPECRGGTRAGYACAIAATTLADFQRCPGTAAR